MAFPPKESDMRCLLTTITATALLASFAKAQVDDIGLYLHGGLLTVLYGQECGPVGCQPFPGGPIAAGETRTLTHYSAPSSIFAIAVGLPGPCTPLPGIDNPLLLGSIVFLDAGITSSPPFVALPCQQGIGQGSLTIPPNTPAGLVIRMQSIGISPSTGGLALGPTIEATIF